MNYLYCFYKLESLRNISYGKIEEGTVSIVGNYSKKLSKKYKIEKLQCILGLVPYSSRYIFGGTRES